MSDYNHLEKLSFAQIEAFDSVLRLGSVSAAARKLDLSQPAISATLARMEKELRLKLFKRRGNGIEPTPEALGIADSVAFAVRAMDEVRNRAQSIRTNQSGYLTIAAQPLVANAVLPQLVASFTQSPSAPTVRIHTASSQIVRSMVASGQVDIGFADLPHEVSGVSAEVFRLPCMATLPAEHPLASEQVITPAHLKELPFISQFSDREVFHRVRRAFVDSGYNMNIVAETDNFSVAHSIVANGGGFSVMDPFTAAIDIGGAVVARPFMPEIMYEIAVYLPELQPLSSAAAVFLEKFRECMHNAT